MGRSEKTAKRETFEGLRPRVLVGAITKWFGQVRRDLPWRVVDPATGMRNPYFSLVSELMLQQTQVSRVLEKCGPFMERFPTAAALAAASEDEVLSAWTGLGYYRRARLLHAAAKVIVERHGGQVPSDLDALMALPGVGRYTAGAIASIAFGKAAPLVDTNVSRVILRVGGVDVAGDDKAGLAWVWEQAEVLAVAAHKQGVVAEVNEGLMELGALVCTSDNPACLVCPLRDVCKARAMGKQREIPRAKKQAARKPVVHTVLVLSTADGRTLVERRAGTGLWAGLWQAPTIEGAKPASEVELRGRVGVLGKVRLGTLRLRQDEDFVFQTTHRDVTFRVYRGEIAAEKMIAESATHTFLAKETIAELGMSSPMRRILLDGTQQTSGDAAGQESQRVKADGVKRAKVIQTKRKNGVKQRDD